MCGIAGILHFDPNHPIDRARLVAMTTALAHRGPDADGFYVGPGVGLGHRRLSIIDLATGDQPLANEDRTVWVVFNGEIYNFAELRDVLEGAGHRFRTHSDTEVIVHAYEEWGEHAVDRFRGMFAFALWDERRRRLLLVRDRLGIKPLYYAVTQHGIVFGSEIKALLEDPDVPRRWSAEAIDAYLAMQYIPGPRTIYRDIWKLPPGHQLIVDGGRVGLRRYWDLAFTGDGDPSREDEYLDRLDALVTEAVRMRLLADVPLGAFLSGGIDSSVVVAAMKATSTADVVTTSVGFDDPAFDEIAHARAVASHLDYTAHEEVVTPHIADLLPKLVWHLDEPFADSSAVPTYYVSAAARKHVTVALSGDGGDELWAGYPWHRVEYVEHLARRRLGMSGSHAVGLLAGYLPLAVKGTRSLRQLTLPPDEACAQKHAYAFFDATTRQRMYTPDFAHTIRDADPLAPYRLAYNACTSDDPLDRTMYVDVKTYLVDDILTKVDKMSMAVALEARVPLLDHKLLEFAASVPSSLKIRNGRGKYLLRRLLERRVPKAIVDRPKHGFEAPIGGWLRGPLSPLVEDLFMDGRMRNRGVFEEQAVRRLWKSHLRGSDEHRHRLWSLMMLELWFRQFVDSPTCTSAHEVAA